MYIHWGNKKKTKKVFLSLTLNSFGGVAIYYSVRPVIHNIQLEKDLDFVSLKSHISKKFYQMKKSVVTMQPIIYLSITYMLND